MRLNRFCSHRELQAILRGGKVTNDKDHYQGGKGGFISRGFCLTEDEPEVAWRYLKGIVTPGVCLTFEIPDGLITRSQGKYLDRAEKNGGTMVMRTCLKTEWCIGELRYDWLRDIIPLESFVQEHELEAARNVERLRQSELAS